MHFLLYNTQFFSLSSVPAVMDLVHYAASRWDVQVFFPLFVPGIRETPVCVPHVFLPHVRTTHYRVREKKGAADLAPYFAERFPGMMKEAWGEIPAFFSRRMVAMGNLAKKTHFPKIVRVAIIF